MRDKKPDIPLEQIIRIAKIQHAISEDDIDEFKRLVGLIYKDTHQTKEVEHG